MLQPWMIERLKMADTLARRARAAAIDGKHDQAARLRAQFDQVHVNIETALDVMASSFFKVDHSDSSDNERSIDNQSK